MTEEQGIASHVGWLPDLFPTSPFHNLLPHSGFFFPRTPLALFLQNLHRSYFLGLGPSSSHSSHSSVCHHALGELYPDHQPVFSLMLHSLMVSGTFLLNLLIQLWWGDLLSHLMTCLCLWQCWLIVLPWHPTQKKSTCLKMRSAWHRWA